MVGESIQSLSKLRNRYFAMRHGQSEANAAGLIVSQAQNGVPGYGLTAFGRHQVETGVSASALDATVRILSSDFKRARDSAEIAHSLLGCDKPVTFDTRLRERNFGDLELGPDARYAEVWTMDGLDAGVSEQGVESVASILQRALAVVIDCEQQFNDESCLLVAHGDILQILQTAFYRMPANRHRDLAHLQTAEVRALKLQLASNR